MSLYVVMIELTDRRWYLRKNGEQYTVTSSLASAFNFRSIPSAEAQKSRWLKKYPNIGTYRVIYSADKPRLLQLDWSPVQEIDDG